VEPGDVAELGTDGEPEAAPVPETEVVPEPEAVPEVEPVLDKVSSVPSALHADEHPDGSAEDHPDDSAEDQPDDSAEHQPDDRTEDPAYEPSQKEQHDEKE